MVYIREFGTVGDNHSTYNGELEREKTNSKASLPVTDPHGDVDNEQRCPKCKILY